MRDVPWWGVVSSAAAPVLLIGGWTVAAALQPGTFDQVTGTISALAADGAADRWVMTLAFLGVGACYVVTGLALRPVALPGRILLMAGGVAVALVAANPLPGGGGGSARHTAAAAISFITLATWPVPGARQPPSAPWVVRRGRTLSAPWVLRRWGRVGSAAVLLALLVWFGVELNTAGGPVGLAERVLAAAEALWPLAVVLACRLRRGRAGARRGLDHEGEV